LVNLQFGRVGTPALSDNKDLRLASLDDLLGHKLKVLLQRVELKDYQDIAALLRAGLHLEKGLGAASSLFPKMFPPAEAVRALTYFEGGDVRMLSQEDRATLIATAGSIGPAEPMPLLSRDLTEKISDKQNHSQKDPGDSDPKGSERRQAEKPSRAPKAKDAEKSGRGTGYDPW
jgi:hypothetical protein